MADLTTFFNNPGVPTPGMEGDTITERGTDPNVTFAGDNAWQPIWQNAPVPDPGGQEDANTVSGLPATPNRFEPSGTPPEPPSLQDRNPGTIDQR